MDEERFDSLTRFIGAGMSRRSLMGAVGAIAGSLLGIHQRRRSKAAGCASDNDCPGLVCCSGVCSNDACCGWDDTTHCWQGSACENGVCVPYMCNVDADCYDATRICCLGYCEQKECCGGGDETHCLSGYYCATANCPAGSPCCLAWPL